MSTSNPGFWRLVTGFLLAPALPCLAFVLIAGALSDEWNGFWFFVGMLVVVADGLSFTVALPFYLLLRRWRPIRLVECVVSGAITAIVLNIALLLLPRYAGYSAADGGGTTFENGHITAHGYASMMLSTAVQSCLGMAIGVCFWIIAIRAVGPKQKALRGWS